MNREFTIETIKLPFESKTLKAKYSYETGAEDVEFFMERGAMDQLIKNLYLELYRSCRNTPWLTNYLQRKEGKEFIKYYKNKKRMDEKFYLKSLKRIRHKK